MFVRVTQSGGSSFEVGAIVEIKQFLEAVKFVLSEGGVMPVAVIVSE